MRRRARASGSYAERGRTLGALSFGSRREHAFGPEELALAHQLARRVGLALDNARLDADGATCTSACAGHAPPLIVRGATGEVEEAGAWGTLLGAVPEAAFTDVQVRLAAGDALVCWTDGVTERRVDGVLFGEERLRELVASLAGESAEAMAARIDDAVVAHAPGLPNDDVAILTLRLVGAAAAPDPGASAELRDASAAE